jgi:tetratricopeptide (TPR) repeat protein
MNPILKNFNLVKFAVLMRSFISKTKNQQLLLIVLCAFTVNVNTLFNKFVFDDTWQVVENRWITNIKYIPEIFCHAATHVEQMATPNYYRPLMNIIYMTNYYVFNGLKPWGFHLVNVLFHVGVTILVFSIASILFHDVRPTPFGPFLSIPLVSALIFAVHPIHSEVVAWVGCVPELSFTFFCLLSLYFHMRSLRNFDQGHLLSLAFFSIAIFCKETAVTLLPLLALYDYMFRSEKFDIRRNVTRYVPFVMVVGIYSILRINALSGVAPMRTHLELNSFEAILNIITLFSQYLEKLLFPIKLNAYHVLHPVHSITDPIFLFSLAVVLAFVALSFVLFKKNKTAFFGLMIILIPLLPVFYIWGIGENTFAERYLYFPSIGFALTAGSFFTIEGINGDRWRIPLSILLGAVLIVYSIGTIDRNKIWHDDISLWTDTIKKSPDSDNVHDNLGVALADKGDLDTAIREYEEALAINPNYFWAYNNLGGALSKKGDLDAAIKAYQEAITLNASYFQAHYNLGNALAKKGDLDAAIKAYQEAITLNPDYFEAHDNLGSALAKKGDLNAAIKEYKEAIAINPYYFKAHNNLGIALANKGELDAAIREYKQAIAINPDSFEAHNNLGSALANKGELDAAIKEFQEALTLNPDFFEANYNLGIAISKRGGTIRP